MHNGKVGWGDRALHVDLFVLFCVCVGVMMATPPGSGRGLAAAVGGSEGVPAHREEHAAAMRRDAEDTLLHCQVVANDSSKNVFARSVV